VMENIRRAMSAKKPETAPLDQEGHQTRGTANIVAPPL